MIIVSKNAYIDKLEDIIHKYNNIYHSTIKIKHADIKSNTNINSGKEISNKGLKFKIGDIVKKPNYKKKFTKGCTPNWFEEVIKKATNTEPWTYVNNCLNK